MMFRLDCPDAGAISSMVEVMRAWRAAHADATFADIEVEATRQVASLRTALIAAALTAEAPASAPDCTACGRVMERVGNRTRTITTSHQEPVPVTGPRYRCSACGAELFPPR